jgi:hypothetical protein
MLLSSMVLLSTCQLEMFQTVCFCLVPLAEYCKLYSLFEFPVTVGFIFLNICSVTEYHQFVRPVSLSHLVSETKLSFHTQ